MRAQTGLVLQGGGALGAFEYGALKRLYEEPGFSVDVVAGVSIGAINAACLVGAAGDPMKTLGEIWERFTVISPPFVPGQIQRFLSLFGNPSFYRMRWDYPMAACWTSFYETDPLRGLLREVIDFDKLNTSATNLLISATNILTGNIEVFDNRRMRITEEHIVASGSLPPGFPMTRIGEGCYWDGGLFNNTPLSPVVERLDPDPRVEKRLFVITLFPNRAKVPVDMLGVLDRMFELVFSSKLLMDVETTQRIDQFVDALDQIDASLPEETRRRIYDLPGYRRLRQYKMIRNVIVISDEDPELVSGPFDFSASSIARRIDAGYRAAADTLRSVRETGGSGGERDGLSSRPAVRESPATPRTW